jgi:DNA-binding NtrC family response regulator
MLIRITLAINDAKLRKRIKGVLTRPDILVQMPRIHKELWERIVCEPSDILIISEAILRDSLKNKVKELQHHPDSPAAVVLSDSSDLIEHAHLMAAGCDAVLFTGLAVEQVREVIEMMLEKRRRLTQKLFFTSKPLAEPRLADFVSESPGMTAFMNIVPRVVQSNTALLIEGETGVGKERLACAIHKEGLRSAGRFVALNCGALPENLLESELFGHVRGAFTGATAARRGWFEIAHGGTLFLDEVGEIPFHLQVKLLRVLQEREIQPIGSERSFGVDVRIIAAGNRPLEAEVEAGRFRRDLYHRLSVVTITIPPLRDRIEDIPVMIERHIQHISRQMGRHVTKINETAMQAMCQYSWPGNVRELNNVIERAILLCDDTEITLDNLPSSFSETAAAKSYLTKHRATLSNDNRAAYQDADQALYSTHHHLQLPEQWLTKSLHEVRTEFLFDLERQYIEGLLIVTNGRIGEVAKRAEIQERSLYEKMKRFGLRKENFKQFHSDKEIPTSTTLSAESEN